MATRKPPKPKRDTRLPGEAELERVYRAGGSEAPSAALDAAILAEAQRAVARSATPQPFHLRWAAPLSTAAVVVLAVGVTLFMTQEGALNHRTELDAPNEYMLAPATPPEADAATRKLRDATEPAKAKRAVPELVAPAAQAPAPVAESAEGMPAKQAPVEVMKKTDTPPAARAPASGRAMETEQAGAVREGKARVRSATTGMADMKAPAADVIGVRVSGSPGAYQFNVTIKSPDTGCQQFADWWEVVSEDGKLLYRRVLLHSHVDEQPFTRSGGPVPVQPDTVIWIRAHMNNTGYGSMAFKGSVKGGFASAEPPANFAAGLAKQQPLPEGCDF